MNPSSVNKLSVEMADFDHSTPSLSSDDTLATSTASPDASNGSHEQISDSPLLLGGYTSTDDGESEDGTLNSHSLLGD